MSVLQNLAAPQLWILGGQDHAAPRFETMRRLAELRRASRPITAVQFPHADHGLYEFETRPDGERLSTRQPEGYLQMMVDFIKGKDIRAGHEALKYRSAEA